jgi:DNA-binding MarR family transcriptional regulator
LTTSKQGAVVASDPRIHSELNVLTAVEQGTVVTQAALTKRIGISIGLINALLKRAILMGYVKTRQAPYKRYAYYLTPKGFAKKSRLVAEYLDSSLRFFRSARNQYAEVMAAAGKAGMTRLALVGNGELAEIALLSAWGEDVTVIGLIDPKANESRRYGLDVLRSLAEADNCDAVVITDSKEPQKSYDEMCAILPASRVLAPPLLKITPDRAGLIAAQKQLGDAA